MGAFVGIPSRTGHETILVGGVLVNIEYSLDGKGKITITVGDPWEVVTEKLSRDEFETRKKEVLQSVANMKLVSTIGCGAGCEAAFQAALNAGVNRLQALEDYRNCTRRCFGVGPE